MGSLCILSAFPSENLCMPMVLPVLGELSRYSHSGNYTSVIFPFEPITPHPAPIQRAAHQNDRSAFPTFHLYMNIRGATRPHTTQRRPPHLPARAFHSPKPGILTCNTAISHFCDCSILVSGAPLQPPLFSSVHSVAWSVSRISTTTPVSVSMPDPEPVKKRRRPPLSCEQCRKRKIKCDRSYPCNNCAKSNTETCTYAPTQIPKSRRRPGRNKARASPPEANSAPVSLRPAGYADFGGVLPTTGATLLETPDSEQFHRTSVWQPLRASSATKPASSGAAGSRGSVGANQSHAAVNGAEYGTEFESGHANNAAGEQQPSQYTPPPKGSISKGRYFGQSHWMNIAASVSGPFLFARAPFFEFHLFLFVRSIS